ncbi:dehydrogenase-like protein [Dinothrombium tinctorium]|uniref:Dehydrogenase-like protein n=1 Tax=Dinothrombium tinctorium TaxID=1965070 RepID=A0A3S3REZ1_9ACAR|nr:dehydrogenase-like protein [Dinothrombium tinctorium]
MYAPFALTKNGFESHFAVNYLGHCLLILSLLPVAAETGQKFGTPSRIINVASSTHFVRNLRLNDLHGISLYSPYHAYAQSKLSQIMFTYKLHSLMKIQQLSNYVTVNCLHPGVAKTELYEYVWWVKLFPSLAAFMFRTAEEGAETVLFAALSKEMEGVGGKYLEDCSIVNSSAFSYNIEAQNKLWNETLNMLKPWIQKAVESPLLDIEKCS